MARSEEAILRRALKRERTEGEQRYADRTDMNRQEELNKLKEKNGATKKADDNNNKRPRISKPDNNNSTNTNDRGGYTRESSINPSSNNNSSSTAFRGRDHGNKKPVDPMKENGAWICSQCKNSNFASRRHCNSKTCDQTRPFQPMRENDRRNSGPSSSSRNNGRSSAPRSSGQDRMRRKPPPSKINKPADRHDESTSKKLVWSKQANSRELSKNQELRQRYRETGGEGMDAKDSERAKLLIARDERKQEKKKNSNQKVEPVTETTTEEAVTSTTTPTTEEAVTSTTTATTTEEEKSNSISNEGLDQKKTEEEKEGDKTSSPPTKSDKKKKTSEAQAKRDQNKALRQLFTKTGGKGMRVDQVERAKLLIARDEKKQKLRAEKEANKKQ